MFQEKDSSRGFHQKLSSASLISSKTQNNLELNYFSRKATLISCQNCYLSLLFVRLWDAWGAGRHSASGLYQEVLQLLVVVVLVGLGSLNMGSSSMHDEGDDCFANGALAGEETDGVPEWFPAEIAGVSTSKAFHSFSPDGHPSVCYLQGVMHRYHCLARAVALLTNIRSNLQNEAR